MLLVMLNIPSITHFGCSLELTILFEVFCDKSSELMATGCRPVYANNCHILLKLEFASVRVRVCVCVCVSPRLGILTSLCPNIARHSYGYQYAYRLQVALTPEAADRNLSISIGTAVSDFTGRFVAQCYYF